MDALNDRRRGGRRGGRQGCCLAGHRSVERNSKNKSRSADLFRRDWLFDYRVPDVCLPSLVIHRWIIKWIASTTLDRPHWIDHIGSHALKTTSMRNLHFGDQFLLV